MTFAHLTTGLKVYNVRFENFLELSTAQVGISSSPIFYLNLLLECKQNVVGWQFLVKSNGITELKFCKRHKIFILIKFFVTTELKLTLLT